MVLRHNVSYQVWENLNSPSYTNISFSCSPWVLAKNSSLYLGLNSQRDSKSGSRFSSSLICCTLIWHSHLACKNTNSRRQACKNGSLALTVWITTTVLKLSHSIVTFPEMSLPQTSRATIRVNISSPLMCIPSSWMNAGNTVWIWWSWNHPPAPVREASQANVASRSDQSISGMTKTPL